MTKKRQYQVKVRKTLEFTRDYTITASSEDDADQQAREQDAQGDLFAGTCTQSSTEVFVEEA